MLWAYRERVLDLKQDKRFRYILIFKNHGAAAGASLEHPHSQLIALPIVPRQRARRDRRRQAALRAKERCVFCDIVRQELDSRVRVIQRERGLRGAVAVRAAVSVRDVAAAEAPRSTFEDAPRHEYESLARMLKEMLQRMNRALESPPFNLIIHSAPFSEDDRRVSTTGTSRSCRS